MNDDKQLIIHFNNGSKLEMVFPTQIKNSTAAVVDALKRILEGDKLVIQTDRQLFIIPWSSVKFVESDSVPGAVLPFGTIKDARVVASSDAPPAPAQ